MDISIEFQIERLAKRLGTIQQKIIPLAASSSINKATAKANTQAKRQIMAQVGLPQNAFKSRFKTFKASPRRLIGRFWLGLKHGKRMGELTAGQRKKQWAKYGVLSQPFRATMRSGKTSQFVRVQQTGSRKGSQGWTKGRPRTSSENLPVVDIENTRVRIPEALASRVVKGLQLYVRKEFSTQFHREVRNRLRRLRSK